MIQHWPQGLPNSTSQPKHRVLGVIFLMNLSVCVKKLYELLKCFIWGHRGWPVVGWTRGHGGMVAGSLSTQRPLQTLAHPHQQTRCPTLCCHEGWWSKDKNILLFGSKITTKYQNNSHHIFLSNFSKLEYSPHFISGSLPLHGTICLYSEPDIVSHRRVWIPGTLMSPGTNKISEPRTNTIDTCASFWWVRLLCAAAASWLYWNVIVWGQHK